MAKILIIDDSKEILEFLSLFLIVKGYEVRTATSESDLHQIISLFAPNLILLEVWLYGKNGRDLCKEVKANNPIHTIPLILLCTSSELLKNYEECEADDIIEKPFELEDIASKIEFNLSKYAA